MGKKPGPKGPSREQLETLKMLLREFPDDSNISLGLRMGVSGTSIFRWKRVLDQMMWEQIHKESGR